MAIIQISKVQARSGNLVDLPQLDNAEFGLASDSRRLFIGNQSNITGQENIEVLTSYSNISFSQIDGAVGNLNIDANVSVGEVLTYDGNNWVNRGGDTGGLINLGDISNVKIEGGALGYVLETDGTGNLNFSPKSTIVAFIDDVTQANPAVVTTTENNFFTTGVRVTITDVDGMTELNGNDYYVSILTSNTFALYSDSSLTTTVNSTGYSAYTGNGRAISLITGAGALVAGGANTTIQYNESSILNGSPSLTFDYNASPKVLTVVGNANVSNLNATASVTASRLISNVATGTAPLVVTSTTQVANLNVATAGTAYSVAGANVSGEVAYAAVANSVAGANVSGQVSYAAVANSVAGANVSGTVGLATYATTANAVAGANVSGEVAYAAVANSVAGANVSGQVSNALISSTVYTSAQPNITSVSSSFTTLTFADSQTISGNNLTLTTGANTNPGVLTGNWTLSAGSQLQATFADLAEYYEADMIYEAGTVLEFGGNKEVTLASDGSIKVAGVVSSNPAYVMNAQCPGNAVAIALQGRVPVKVRGSIQKGDMMISGGNGFARPSTSPQIGTVIGKALENFEGTEGVIEIAIGRL